MFIICGAFKQLDTTKNLFSLAKVEILDIILLAC